ncbi:hypothetical protein KAH55_09445 [bacterium]|nr:hypothetical protein [bacterium]
MFSLPLRVVVLLVFIGFTGCINQDSKSKNAESENVMVIRKIVADKSNFTENIGGKFIVHQWEKEGLPVLEKQYDWEGIGPNYVKLFEKDDGYLMFIGGYCLDGINKNNYPTGIAWSDDGLKWKRHPKSLDKDGFDYQALDRAYFPGNPTGYDYLGLALYRATAEVPFRIDFYKSVNGIDWEKFKKNEKTWWFGPSDVIDFFYDYTRKKFYMYHKIWKVEGTKLDGKKYEGYFPGFRPEYDREKGTVRIRGPKELFTNRENVDFLLHCKDEGYEDGGGGTITKNMRMLRVIAIAESEDFLTWTNQKVILEPEFENDTAQFYSSPVLPYHGLHLCFPRYLQGDTGEMHALFGVSDTDKLELASKEPVLSCGSKGEWDSGLILGAAPIEINDKLCMYYAARRTDHTIAATSSQVSALGRAWLRKDGFVSFTGGTLITKEFDINGRELRINAKGRVTARLLNDKGEEIAVGYFSGDSIDEKILEIEVLKKGKYHLEFDCINGELFSYWFN